MKRDLDLIRNVLIEIEQDVDWPGSACWAPEDPVKSYQLHLAIQAGLVEATESHVLGGAPPRFVITGLTWQGHEFLAASADQDRWGRFKKSAGTALSSIPFPVITRLLVDGAEQTVRSALQSHGFLS